MSERHWTDEDLLNHLYGLGPEDSHPDTCESCRDRLQALLARRRQMLAEPEISPLFLAAQRRGIYRRLDGPVTDRWSVPLAPALAATAAVVLGVLLSRPAPEQEARILASGESQFYTEIYTTIAGEMPRAAEPIQGLFQQ